MTRHIIMTLTVLLLFAGGLMTAQDDDIPFPPDPSEIFANGIEAEIVSSSGLEQDQNASPEPVIGYDDRARILTIHDSSYPYPQEISRIWSYLTPTEMLYTFEVDEFVDDTETLQQWVWYFDAETETFSRFESSCPLHSPLSLYESQLIWEIVGDEEQPFLCEISTGNRIPLPSEYRWYSAQDRDYEPELSPDGAWLVFFASGIELPGQVAVFSYEFATEELRKLGELPSEEHIRVGQWFGDTVVISATNTPTWSGRFLYIATANETESLEWAISGYYVWPEYYDNPPRYEYVFGPFEDAETCAWQIYDIETRQITIHDLGTMCLPVIGELDETAYYLDVPDIYSDSILVRFNAITGEREDLYSGEIEDVLQVSDDGRYATLILDNNGQINTHTPMPTEQISLPDEPTIAYIDLVTDEILFEFPVGWEIVDVVNGYPRGDLRPLGDGTFLALTNTVVGYSEEFAFSTANLIVQENGVYVEEFLVDNALQIVDNQHLLIAPQGSLSEGIEIFDIESRTSRPFIRPFDGTRYVISFNRYDTSRIILSLGREYDARRVIYDVDLP